MLLFVCEIIFKLKEVIKKRQECIKSPMHLPPIVFNGKIYYVCIIKILSH